VSHSDTESGSSPTSTSGGPRGKIVLEGEANPDDVDDPIERAEHPRADELLETDRSEIRARRYYRPEALDLPGFGEPLEDCGEKIPPAMRFCSNSGRTHRFKRNCLRYDCPRNAPYAIRRRAAGADEDFPGLAPQLKSLISWLWGARDELTHHYHHLVYDVPDDYLTESVRPLERLRDAVAESMQGFGIQGAVIFHPFRHKNEDPGETDMGDWRELLFHYSDWSNARDELVFDPHFHVIGIAPHVDVSVVDEFHERTGWVIHRITDDDGASIRGREDESDDLAMCRALTYCLSHAGIYETSQQRRLAAWIKGPDVNRPDVYHSTRNKIADLVHRASEDTLGIAPPDLKCDCDYHAHTDGDERTAAPDPTADTDVDGSVSIEDLSGPIPDAWDRQPETAKGGTGGMGGSMSDPQIDATGGIQSTGTDLPNDDGDLDLLRTGASSSSTSSRSESSTSADDDIDTEDVEPCGASLKHISQAGEYLLDSEWREQAPYADELESAHLLYTNYMRSENMDPLEGEPRVPEHRDHDAPPPD